MDAETERRVRLTLADEIEAARNPSRLLDCRIWLLYGQMLGRPYRIRGRDPVQPDQIVQGRWFGSALEKYPEDVHGVASNWRVPAFTESTDAAQRLLANIGYVVHRPIGKGPSVATEVDGEWSEYSKGANVAIAMCAASLRAGGPVIYVVGSERP